MNHLTNRHFKTHVDILRFNRYCLLVQMRKKWTESMILDEILGIYNATGKMPTASLLKETGRNDLSNQISKKGGFEYWASRSGLKRAHSDSDTGWEGEKAVADALNKRFGIKCEKTGRVKWPFDILVEGLIRVDVKSARYAEYGPCRGWFYRIGKAPQADIIALHQLDTGETYWIPWNMVSHSNVTISRDGGIYKKFRGADWVLLRAIESKRLFDNDVSSYDGKSALF